MDRFEYILEVTLNSLVRVLMIVVLISALLMIVTGATVLFQEFFTGGHNIIMEQLCLLGTYILMGAAFLSFVILCVLTVFDL